MKPSKFFATIGPAAQEHQRATGLFASVTLAQAALETGFGKSTPVDIDTGQQSYNLFGVKGTGPAGSVRSGTREVRNDVSGPEIGTFRAYHSWSESLADHDRLLASESRYAPVRAAQTPYEACRQLYLCGYATDAGPEIDGDPRYDDKLMNLIRNYNLKQFDISKEGEQVGKYQPQIVKERIFASGGKLVRCDGDYKQKATDVRFVQLDAKRIKTRLIVEKGKTVSALVKEYGADLGINFPFFDEQHGYLYGDVVSDGKLIRQASGDYRVNFGSRDGKLFIEKNVDVVKNPGDWITSTGPLLVEPLNGKPTLCYAYYRQKQGILPDIANNEDTVRCQRTFVGLDAAGNLLIGIGDGRTQYDRGLNCEEMGLYMMSKGAVIALNGDGGGSTIIADRTGGINQAENTGRNERIVNHALLIWYEDDMPAPKPQPAFKDSDPITYGDLKKLGLIK